jgi:large subunit ribosomal protein L10
MPTERKNETIRCLREQVAGRPSFILTDFRGLTVDELRMLRRQLRAGAARYTVVKNTLFAKALEGTAQVRLAPFLAGPTGIAFAGDDVVAAAKAVVQFARESKKLQIKAGFVDGTFYDAPSIEQLATLPSRPELLATLIGSLRSPLAGLINVLNGNRRGLVQVLAALQSKRAQAAAQG